MGTFSVEPRVTVDDSVSMVSSPVAVGAEGGGPMAVDSFGDMEMPLPPAVAWRAGCGVLIVAASITAGWF